MNFVSKEIEDYCIEHSSNNPSQHCSDIESYTRSSVPHSVMLTGKLEGSFLTFLIHLTGAERVLEFGCFTGYSALTMAEALPENGKVITLDINEETDAIAKNFWQRSPHGKKIRSVVGPALETLKNLNESFDFVFIDADKPSYVAYLKAVLPLLKDSGLIVVDNTLYSGKVLSQVKEEGNAVAIHEFNSFVRSRNDLEATLLPIRDGMTLIRKRKPLSNH